MYGTVCIVSAQSSQKRPYSQTELSGLRLELLDMQNRDQQIRDSVISNMASNKIDSSLIIQMKRIDSVNTLRIKQIIQHYGWPGKSMIGVDGADAVFLIVQHSSDKLFQRNCLPLMEKAYKNGEASGPDLALLTDRVLIYSGKPQLYGSQVRIVNGKIEIDSVLDMVNLDKRRANYGLPPMNEYLKMLKEVYHISD